MLKKVKIENFRGIKNLDIDDLSLVNVFIGSNNSGKSTIMDAIYWGLKETIEPSLSNILKRRVLRNVELPELFYGYNDDLTIRVALSFDNGESYTFKLFRTKENLQLRTLNEARLSIGPGQVILTFEKTNAPELYTCQLGLNCETIGRSSLQPSSKIAPEVVNYARQARFLLSHVRLDDLWRDLEEVLSKLKLKGENEFIMRFNDIYNIKNYEFLPMPIRTDTKMAAFSEGNLRVYGAFQGAGVQRGALILSLMEILSNTALFIEEPETYQNPTAMEGIVKHMVELSERNKIQLFITTHSYHDFLGKLYYVWKEDEELKRRDEEFRCYRITKENGNVRAERLNGNIVREYVKTI